MPYLVGKLQHVKELVLYFTCDVFICHTASDHYTLRWVSHRFLLDYRRSASRIIISLELRTSHLSRQPCVAVDDSKMGGRGLKIQIHCKHFFQLFCNCLIIRENNFNSSRLDIHGLHWPTLDNWQEIHEKCPIMNNFVR